MNAPERFGCLHHHPVLVRDGHVLGREASGLCQQPWRRSRVGVLLLGIRHTGWERRGLSRSAHMTPDETEHDEDQNDPDDGPEEHVGESSV